MKISFTTLDVFTTTRYSGNPLAIVHLPEPSTLTQAQKQSISKEFNLSETVFLHTSSSSGQSSTVPIDIFTTENEIPFAGHPTIGTAWYLLHDQKKYVTELHTKAGIIPISTLPSPTSSSKASVPTPVVRAIIPFSLHLHDTFHLIADPKIRSYPPSISIVKGMTFILAEVYDLASLEEATTSLQASPWDTSKLDEGWQVGLTGTLYYFSLGTKDEQGRKQYRTRMHAGIEDPATGSASAALGAWLAMREQGDEPTFSYAFEQGVEMGSPSQIGVDVDIVKSGEASLEWIKKIVLSGAAVKVMEGTLEV